MSVRGKGVFFCTAAALSASLAFGGAAMANENTIAFPYQQESAWDEIALINDDTVSTGVNIRMKADEDSPVIGCLYEGGAAWVLRQGEEWTEVYSGGLTGFVKNEYLVRGEAAKEAAQNHGVEGVATTWDDVKLYSGADGGSEVLDSLAYGDSFILTQDEGHWLQVQRGADSTAYVSSDDVSRVLLLDTAVATDEAYLEAEDPDGAASGDAQADAAAADETYADDASADGSYTGDASADDTYTDDASADSSYMDSASADETYTGDISADSSYTDNASAEESYTDDASANGSYTDDTSADEAYTDNTSADSSYTDNASAEESYTDDTSADDSYTDDTSADETYMDDTSADSSYTDTTGSGWVCSDAAAGIYYSADAELYYDSGTGILYDANWNAVNADIAAPPAAEESSSGGTDEAYTDPGADESYTDDTGAEGSYTDASADSSYTDATGSGWVCSDAAAGIYYNEGSGLYYDSGTGILYDANWNAVNADIAVPPTTEEAGTDESYTDDSGADESYAEDPGDTAEEQSSSGSDDTSLLAALIYCEAGNQSYDGMVAVGAVVMNRVNSPSFPNSISEVIYQGGQFTPASSGALASALANGVPSTCYDAAAAALNGENPIGSALYFNTGSGKGVKLGDHQFY